jgi:hypothetical protein
MQVGAKRQIIRKIIDDIMHVWGEEKYIHDVVGET